MRETNNYLEMKVEIFLFSGSTWTCLLKKVILLFNRNLARIEFFLILQWFLSIVVLPIPDGPNKQMISPSFSIA